MVTAVRSRATGAGHRFVLRERRRKSSPVVLGLRLPRRVQTPERRVEPNGLLRRVLDRTETERRVATTALRTVFAGDRTLVPRTKPDAQRVASRLATEFLVGYFRLEGA